MLLADEHVQMCLRTYVNVSVCARPSLKTESSVCFFRNAHEMLFLKMNLRDLFTKTQKFILVYTRFSLLYCLALYLCHLDYITRATPMCAHAYSESERERERKSGNDRDRKIIGVYILISGSFSFHVLPCIVRAERCTCVAFAVSTVHSTKFVCVYCVFFF